MHIPTNISIFRTQGPESVFSYSQSRAELCFCLSFWSEIELTRRLPIQGCRLAVAPTAFWSSWLDPASLLCNWRKPLSYLLCSLCARHVRMNEWTVESNSSLPSCTSSSWRDHIAYYTIGVLLLLELKPMEHLVTCWSCIVCATNA